MSANRLLERFQNLWQLSKPTQGDVRAMVRVVEGLIRRNREGDATVSLSDRALRERLANLELRRSLYHPTKLELQEIAAGAAELKSAMEEDAGVIYKLSEERIQIASGRTSDGSGTFTPSPPFSIQGRSRRSGPSGARKKIK